jgi:hypothetical protein
MGGGTWRPSPLHAQELAATSIKGAGARVIYAFSPWFTFEGEAIGAVTGDASFEGARRSASLFRVQVGGALRFGMDGLIPVVRGGVGLQLGTLDTMGTESEFTAGAIFSVGIGLDYRFTDSLVGGIGTSFTGPLAPFTGDAPTGSIEAGIQLGYRWKPPPQKVSSERKRL